MKYIRHRLPAIVGTCCLASLLSSCAQFKDFMGDSAGQHRPTDLSVVVLPVNTTDPSDSDFHSKIAERMDALKLFKSVKPASWGTRAEADLILSIHQCSVEGGPRCDDERPIVSVSSGRSGKLLYTSHPRATSGSKLGIDPERIAADLAEAFSPDGPLHAFVASQEKPSGELPMPTEMKLLPSGRDQAEDEGDAAAREGQDAAAFTSYVRALDGIATRDETDLRQKLIKLAVRERTLPDIPQEARRHLVRAETYLKIAQGSEDIRTAISEYDEAIAAAPWWAEAYRDLAYAQERLEEHKLAIRNLKLYLAGHPDATDADTVRDRITSLEGLLERAP